MRFQHSIAVLALAICVISCKEQKKEAECPPISVRTMTVEPNGSTAGRTYSGIIEESSGCVLSFTVAGTIRSIHVAEGQKVAKGQLIATLDGATLKHNRDIAAAALATARDTYNRMKLLHDANSVPDMKWVEVENVLKSAESAYAIAENALNDTRLYAPFSGIISRKLEDAGSNVAPGVPVVKLIEISPVKAVISVSENEISRFSRGDVATITTAAADGLSLEGRLVEKGVAADPLSRTYTVKFECRNTDGRLLPGMLCNVLVDGKTDGRDTTAYVLPVNSVLLDDSNRTFVWLVKGGKATRRVIAIDGYMPNGVAVGSGLTTRDSVIIAGQQKVSDGMSVTSINR